MLLFLTAKYAAIAVIIRVELNLNFEFESAHELFMNLNLNFVFSTSMNLNILIKHSTNFEFCDLNLTKQMLQFATGSYQLILQTFHKILSSQQKSLESLYDGKYDAARRFEVVFGHSNLP